MQASHWLGSTTFVCVTHDTLTKAGLADVAGRRVGGFSLGMGQRLGIAAALLGDPEVVMLDEPVNGLDPDGVQWIRGLLRGLAEEGRTVFVSSHLMSEMALTADHLVVIGRGRLIADLAVEELIAQASRSALRIRTPDRDRLRELLAGLGVAVTTLEADLLEVEGARPEQVGDLARQHGLAVYEMTPQRASLEDAFMALTRDAVEFDAREVER